MSNGSGDANNGGQPPPWGQQPPAGGWQQPQPPQGQWGPGPGQFGHNPYQQPPKKSRGPLIATLVALLLVVVGGVIAAIVLMGSDDGDDKSASDAETSASNEGSESSEPTETASTEPTTAPPAGDGQVSGKGYVYTLPEGWSDVTEEFLKKSPMPSIDTVSAAGPALAMSPGNFIVETMSVPEGSTPEKFRASWERTVTGALGGDITPMPTDNVEFGGSDAIGMRFEHDKNPANLPLVQHAYLFIEGDTAYAVSLTMQASEEDELFAKFTELRESWTFQ
ncbi:hypothetical protein ACLM5J_05355 [Nocardioides sp. Bht2]|uniref:hypothetical protein n=1 Tax=Nocardioides sp. Bht2 TaxID=3392297 RepID=UPI0039B3E8FC